MSDITTSGTGPTRTARSGGFSPAMRAALIALAGGEMIRHRGIFIPRVSDGSISVKHKTMLSLVGRAAVHLDERRKRHVFARLTRYGRERAAELLALEAERLAA